MSLKKDKSISVDLKKIIEDRRKLGRLVLVSGDFNILHPGHIRLLRFAKECGDHLLVAINADVLIKNPNYNSESHRADMVSSLGFVDYCFISELDINELIYTVKPDIVVKGKEFEDKNNPEEEALASFRGKLIFSSGYTFQKSTSIFSEHNNNPNINIEKIRRYMAHHRIDRKRIESILDKIINLNVVVIGDSIVDEYLQCNAIGMSQEDPTIVVTPDEEMLFLGGAAITAGHAKGLGAKTVSFYSVLGTDGESKFAKKKLNDYQLESMIFTDSTRPTTKKRRYRVENKTLLRVNTFRDHDISLELQDLIFDHLAHNINQASLVILSDFNYGTLPQSLVGKIISMCKEKEIFIAADSQTSSQIGDISRFIGVDLIMPTERELRISSNNNRDGLVVLAEKLRQQMGCTNIVITLADEGALLHLGNGISWENDKIAALATNALDPSGAGDCMLSATAMSLACGADLWLATLIGSVASACQVSKVGNQPLHLSELRSTIDRLCHASI
ncbi:PfkB family carbohydrate kinase [Luminiphilus sp.]|nr:PfkB family carbohydrate kinase [Luminiphilus sp.]